MLNKSALLFVIGTVLLITAFIVFLISLGYIGYVEEKTDYVSNDVIVPPLGYSNQQITFNMEYGTHFMFTVHEGEIKYYLLDSDGFLAWSMGDLYFEWKEASSDTFYWHDGLSGTTNYNGVEIPTPTHYYVFYNDNPSQSKLVHFDSIKSRFIPPAPNYIVFSIGLALMVTGLFSVILGLYKHR